MMSQKLGIIGDQQKRLYKSHRKHLRAPTTVSDEPAGDVPRLRTAVGHRLRHAVPLVYRIELGQRGLGCDRIHQKPRPVAGSRYGAKSFWRSAPEAL